VVEAVVIIIQRVQTLEESVQADLLPVEPLGHMKVEQLTEVRAVVIEDVLEVLDEVLLFQEELDLIIILSVL